MAKVEIYEYRFVASDFVGEPDKPWEYIGTLLAASHPHVTWTEENIAPIVDEIARHMEAAAAAYEARGARDAARRARECCRTPDRPVLVRIHLDSIDIPKSRV